MNKHFNSMSSTEKLALIVYRWSICPMSICEDSGSGKHVSTVFDWKTTTLRAELQNRTKVALKTEKNMHIQGYIKSTVHFY